MEVRAQLNGVRLAPRKMRAIADLIKKLDVTEALAQLEHYIRRPSPVFIKLLNSAIANAENTYQMVRGNLYIKNIVVDEGIKLKRMFPRAQGRATMVHKKTSRVQVVLDERVPGMRTQASAVAEKAPAHTHARTEEPKKKEETGMFNTLFKRKKS